MAVAEQLPEQLHFVIKKFEVLGDNPLSAAETDDVFSYYLGDHYGLEGIQSAVMAFEGRLRQSGFAFYQVNLAPQRLQDGVIKLQLIQLKVDKVEVEGNKYFSRENLGRNIPTLKAGETPDTRVLSRAINMADAQPSKSLKLQFSENDTGGAINARLKVNDMKTHFAFVSLNNTGNDETGNFRLTGGYQFSNLFDRDHNLSLSYTTSPDDLSAVQQYGASYSIPFYDIGGELSIFLARSDVDSGVVAQTFSVSGAGTIALLHYKHTFLQSGSYKQQLDIGLDHKLFENDIGIAGISGVPVAGSGDVLSRPLSLAYLGFWQGAGKSINFNVAAYKNLSGGSNNTDKDYDQIRSGASADWFLIRYGFAYNQLISEDWFFRLNISGQQSSENLIAGEQFGIGGIYSVRGFDERALLGDSGIQANFELWVPGFSRYDIRPVIFFDYGHTELDSPLANETSSINISSIGTGLRWSIANRLNVVLDLALVTGGAEETNASGSNSATEQGDVKGHIDMFYRF
ncbi:MAG TPA: ShlB/FhaC/HecB family hemolysin secretion/activation protein [Gammaproteobacteria bacterium]|nr:ShlB/FhaC/HecB family hemolysin secretion/activation protein [Gammaproteobacteria bacterium]